MRYMKILTLLVAPCAGFLVGREADASSYVHGAICHRSGSADNWRVDTEGFHSDAGSARQLAICPIPNDHAIGTALQFETLVRDGHNAQVVTCLGAVLDVNGNVIGLTPTASTTTTFTGLQRLSYQLTGADVATHSYMTACELPPVSSSFVSSTVRTLRVF